VLTELFESDTALSFGPVYRRCIPCHIRTRNYALLRPTAHSVMPQTMDCRLHWPRGLRRGSVATRLKGLRVRIPLGHGCLSTSCECCVLPDRSFWVGLIVRPEESYRGWCFQWVWSRSPENGGHDPESGRSAK